MFLEAGLLANALGASFDSLVSKHGFVVPKMPLSITNNLSSLWITSSFGLIHVIQSIFHIHPSWLVGDPFSPISILNLATLLP